MIRMLNIITSEVWCYMGNSQDASGALHGSILVGLSEHGAARASPGCGGAKSPLKTLYTGIYLQHSIQIFLTQSEFFENSQCLTHPLSSLSHGYASDVTYIHLGLCISDAKKKN